MKTASWLLAYEDWNVDVGLGSGLPGPWSDWQGDVGGAGQHGGDDGTKNSPSTGRGANTAWVPSPIAATLHAMHYHHVNVAGRQQALSGCTRADVDDLLTIPLLGDRKLNDSEIIKELENQCTGHPRLCGTVGRPGASAARKCPILPMLYLMEDRATLRISSQHIANWLHHGCDQCTAGESRVSRKWRGWLTGQNSSDPHYQEMSGDLDNSIAFQAALDLVFKGAGGRKRLYRTRVACPSPVSARCRPPRKPDHAIRRPIVCCAIEVVDSGRDRRPVLLTHDARDCACSKKGNYRFPFINMRMMRRPNPTAWRLRRN